MNLSKLFEMQRQLDEHIEKEHPRQEGEDRLAKKILALLVELGELCNCWRGFKYWSNDQEPRTVKYIENRKHRQNPLLEEFVDCLHFILSIGLEKGYDKYPLNSVFENHIRQENITQQFIGLIASSPSVTSYAGYLLTLQLFIGLGKMLGFTWEEIEQAYM